MEVSKASLTQLWSTPVVSMLYKNSDEFNHRLADAILEMESKITSTGSPTAVAGLERGLTAHWMEYNLLNWDYPQCITLRKLVLDGFNEYLKLIGVDSNDPDYQICGISCWANVLRFGQALAIHHHDPSFISAHYTVQTGRTSDDDSQIGDGGHTQYYRPGFVERSMGGKQAGPVSPWDDDWKISSAPIAGKLFLFPSYVRHEVRPHFGRIPRITVALDIYISKQPSSKLIYFAPPRWYVPK